MARPPKDKDELKDQRIAVMMSKAELELIDDWAFASRIRSRGEAIRRLCLRSIVKDRKTVSQGEMKRLMESGEDRWPTTPEDAKAGNTSATAGTTMTLTTSSAPLQPL